MSVPCPVNVVWDFTSGVCLHTHWLPPPSVPPAPNAFIPSVEIPAPQMWTMGYVMGKNKFTTTVKAVNMPVCQSGHDLGPLIPDVTIPPVNVYLPIAWTFSKRQMVFQASTVKMDNQPTGCAAVPLFPMLTCGDPISMPSSFPWAINYTHLVFVGMTIGDILAGLLKIYISMVIDAVFFIIGARGPADEAMTGAQRLAAAAGDRAAEQLVRRAMVREGVGTALETVAGKLGLSGSSMAKNIVNGLAGYGQSAFSEWISPTGSEPSSNINVVGEGVVPQAQIALGGDDGTALRGTGGYGNDPLNIFGGEDEP